MPTKVHIAKVMVFPVVIYGCENWTIKKSEHQRIDAFELWCWRRLLKVTWRARRSNQSILREIYPKYLLERLMVKLKLQDFWLPDVNSQLTGKVPVREYQGQKEKRVSEDEMAGWHHWCNGHELGQISVDGEGQGSLAWCNPRGYKESDMTVWLNNSNNFWNAFTSIEFILNLIDPAHTQNFFS